MVRTTPETEMAKTRAQWRRAWDLLSNRQRSAIVNFCFDQDDDLAHVVLMIWI